MNGTSGKLQNRASRKVYANLEGDRQSRKFIGINPHLTYSMNFKDNTIEPKSGRGAHTEMKATPYFSNVQQIEMVGNSQFIRVPEGQSITSSTRMISQQDFSA